MKKELFEMNRTTRYTNYRILKKVSPPPQFQQPKPHSGCMVGHHNTLY